MDQRPSANGQLPPTSGPCHIPLNRPLHPDVYLGAAYQPISFEGLASMQLPAWYQHLSFLASQNAYWSSAMQNVMLSGLGQMYTHQPVRSITPGPLIVDLQNEQDVAITPNPVNETRVETEVNVVQRQTNGQDVNGTRNAQPGPRGAGANVPSGNQVDGEEQVVPDQPVATGSNGGNAAHACSSYTAVHRQAAPIVMEIIQNRPRPEGAPEQPQFIVINECSSGFSQNGHQRQPADTTQQDGSSQGTSGSDAGPSPAPSRRQSKRMKTSEPKKAEQETKEKTTRTAPGRDTAKRGRGNRRR